MLLKSWIFQNSGFQGKMTGEWMIHFFEERFGFAPREVQHTAMEIAQKHHRAGIFILEAQMGVGKTEAALAVAEILGQKAGSGGIFLRIAYTGYSKRTFPRLMKWAEQQSENVKLGIRLAHGAVELNEDYQQLIKRFCFISGRR